MLKSGRRVLQLVKTRTRHVSRLRIIYIIIVITIVTIISSISTQTPIGFSRPKLEVDNKVDLLTVDVSKQIKSQCVPYMDEFLHSKKFIKERVLGFVSNLDLNKHRNHQNKKKKHNKDASEAIDVNKFRVTDTYENLVTCKDLKYEHDLSFHVMDKKFTSDLTLSRKEILSWKNEYSDKVKDDGWEKDKTEMEIIQKRWFEFGHVSVWLEAHQCYVTYSRVIYTKGPRNWPEVSLIKATAYDKDWNEIKGKRIPYSDVRAPPNIESQLRDLDKDLGLVDCKSLPSIKDDLEIEECEIQLNTKKLKLMKKKETILDNFFFTYPRIINLEAKLPGMFSGAEDPHVILKKDKYGVEEPVIVFNMEEGSGRRIYSFFPHKKGQSMVKFTMEDGEDLGSMQKNWGPFFYPEDPVNRSELSFGSINFMRNISPLHIVRCSLDDGICYTVFKGETKTLSKDKKDSNLRGGTQFIPLPEVIPNVKGKNIWVGFTKSHTDDCGCGPKFYRPILTVLIEVNGVYHIELMASGLDFTISPLNFKLTGTSCDGANVLTPNSIVSWYVASQDTTKHSYEDYMTVSVSEADSLSKTVIIKGVLDYILNIYKDKDIKDTFTLDEEANAIVGATRVCVTDYDFEVCRRYGLKHPVKDKE